MEYAGIDGFLKWFIPSRASLMLDVVFLAMFVVIPVMGWSIWMVKHRQAYLLHKRMQLTLGAVLLVAVALFEADMRINGWEERAVGYPQIPSTVYASLYVHLFFAVTTAVLWIAVILRALRQFPSPPIPGPHSRSHILWGKLAAVDMTLTAITGWVFYWLAFVY